MKSTLMSLVIRFLDLPTRLDGWTLKTETNQRLPSTTVNHPEGITAVHGDSRLAFLVGWRAPITKPMPIA